MTLTAEHRRIAASIDKKIKLLDALGLLEAEILPEMAEYMPDFHHLMMHTSGPEMDALCVEYAGFFRYAKILETVASGIASGKIKVPGGQTVNKENKLAAAIDLRVRQLEAKGISDAGLLEQMVGHILDLQWLWSSVSDEKLIYLCREYPGLYRYGMLMEEAAEAESKKEKTAYGHLPELPESIKVTVAQLLTEGAKIESGFQTIIDGQGQRDLWLEIEVMEGHHEYWVAQFNGLPDKLRTANIPDESHAMMLNIFIPMSQRLNQLHGQVIAERSL
ncbi:MAG: hypothetical protein ABL903_09045 [Methylococcales bacterium]